MLFVILILYSFTYIFEIAQHTPLLTPLHAQTHSCGLSQPIALGEPAPVWSSEVLLQKIHRITLMVKCIHPWAIPQTVIWVGK